MKFVFTILFAALPLLAQEPKIASWAMTSGGPEGSSEVSMYETVKKVENPPADFLAYANKTVRIYDSTLEELGGIYQFDFEFKNTGKEDVIIGLGHEMAFSVVSEIIKGFQFVVPAHKKFVISFMHPAPPKTVNEWVLIGYARGAPEGRWGASASGVQFHYPQFHLTAPKVLFVGIKELN